MTGTRGAGRAPAVLLILLLTTLASGADPTLATTTVAGAEVITVHLAQGVWRSAIVRAADRDAFLARPERVLVNGGYFDLDRQPAGLVIDAGAPWGRLHDGTPYSGFVWADAAGRIRVAHQAQPPDAPRWAIQSGPLLVEPGGHLGINSNRGVAARTVIALRGEEVLVIRTAAIGLRDLAEALVADGVDCAIDLDGGPSSGLHARFAGVATDRPEAVQVPYGVGFAPDGQGPPRPTR